MLRVTINPKTRGFLDILSALDEYSVLPSSTTTTIICVGSPCAVTAARSLLVGPGVERSAALAVAAGSLVKSVVGSTSLTFPAEQPESRNRYIHRVANALTVSKRVEQFAVKQGCSLVLSSLFGRGTAGLGRGSVLPARGSPPPV